MHSQRNALLKISLGVAAVLSATALSTWQLHSSLRVEKEASTLQSLSRESAPFQRLVESRATELRTELALLASRKDSGISFQSDLFDAMAWINPQSKIKWSESGHGNFNESWLKGISFEKLRDGEAYFVKRSEADGSTGFALLMTAEVQGKNSTSADDKVYLFGVLSSSAMAGLVDDWVGSSRSALIFDDKGYVLASTSRRLVGTSLKNDSLVKAALNERSSFVSGNFDDLEGRSSVGHSETIARTNLHLGLSVADRWILEAISKSVQKAFWFSLLFFSGCVLTVLAFGKILTKKSATKKAAHSILEHSPAVEESRLPSLAAQKSEPEPETKQNKFELAPLNFELIEQKAKHNVQEILEKSAEIRARLNLDFVEDIESHGPGYEAPAYRFESDPSGFVERAETSLEPSLKIKIRRPKVTS